MTTDDKERRGEAVGAAPVVACSECGEPMSDHARPLRPAPEPCLIRRRESPTPVEPDRCAFTWAGLSGRPLTCGLEAGHTHAHMNMPREGSTRKPTAASAGQIETPPKLAAGDAASRGRASEPSMPGVTIDQLALMLAECRRATIEACAAWIEERAHTGWRSVDVPAALRAQMPEMATFSVGPAPKENA